MARRAFIGANRRTDGIRRKPGRAEIAKGGGRGGRRPVVSLSRPSGPDSLDPIRVDIIPGGAGGASSNPLDDFGDPRNPGVPVKTSEAIPQSISGFPVDIKLNQPGSGITKGDEIISDIDKKEKDKIKDIMIKPPPPPPPGPFIEDLPDFKPVKTGLGVIGSGGVKQQEILGGPVKVKKKKKIIPIRRKPIKIDVRKVKSKRGNARNNIKAGLTKKIPNGENIIQVINEQIEVTRKTKKVSRPAPVRSVIQLVRPRPSVPVREVRQVRTIAGQPIRRPAPPVPDISPPPPPIRQVVEPRPQVSTAPIRTSRPQVASAPVRTRRRRQSGGRY
tara:strand:- start:1988 stop:2980 length:993 start_codon:yes stop_codon:yes gene_type:complete